MHLFTVVKSTIKTQSQANTVYEAPDFFLAKRLATMLTITALVLTYFTNLPLLLLFSCLYFLVSYWIDKYTLLRTNRKPRLMGIKIIKTKHTLLLFAFITYIITLVQTFGFEASQALIILVFIILLLLIIPMIGNIWLSRKGKHDTHRLTQDSPEINSYVIPDPTAAELFTMPLDTIKRNSGQLL